MFRLRSRWKISADYFGIEGSGTISAPLNGVHSELFYRENCKISIVEFSFIDCYVLSIGILHLNEISSHAPNWDESPPKWTLTVVNDNERCKYFVLFGSIAHYDSTMYL